MTPADQIDPHSKRPEFLIEMYKQMFNDINTHILVVWQSVGVLVGAFAIFALVEKKVVSTDLASALVVLLAAWLLAHLYDASYWYNRNLVIIANIERQFLKQSDLHDVHYYFGEHRKSTSMLTHLRIQWTLGISIATLFTLYHFVTRVLPGIGAPWARFEIQRTLPYVVGVICFVLLSRLHRDRTQAYTNFLKNSPGIMMDTTGIEYGTGHPAQSLSATAKRTTNSSE
jgi:hypothetical protein